MMASLVIGPASQLCACYSDRLGAKGNTMFKNTSLKDMVLASFCKVSGIAVLSPGSIARCWAPLNAARKAHANCWACAGSHPKIWQNIPPKRLAERICACFAVTHAASGTCGSNPDVTRAARSTSKASATNDWEKRTHKAS